MSEQEEQQIATELRDRMEKTASEILKMLDDSKLPPMEIMHILSFVSASVIDSLVPREHIVDGIAQFATNITGVMQKHHDNNPEIIMPSTKTVH